jgi:hypothetical protein
LFRSRLAAAAAAACLLAAAAAACCCWLLAAADATSATAPGVLLDTAHKMKSQTVPHPKDLSPYCRSISSEATILDHLMFSRSAQSFTRRFFATRNSPTDVVIVSAVRTPVGLFNGGLAPLSASQLGSVVIKAAVARGGIKADDVDEVIMGNVVSAGIGQAPARQASKFAGLPDKTICNTINKVCSSGMKAVMVAAQTIALGQVHCSGILKCNMGLT